MLLHKMFFLFFPLLFVCSSACLKSFLEPSPASPNPTFLPEKAFVSYPEPGTYPVSGGT